MLTDFFQIHIAQGFSKDICRKLISALKEDGYRQESIFLNEYLRNGDTKLIIQEGVWKGHTCYIGQHPPPAANDGDIWFDVMELTPMVFVTVANSRGWPPFLEWIATHPVYVWQFKAFARVVEWRHLGSGPQDDSRFLNIDLDRQENNDYVRWVTNEEACAYTQWFGKFPVLQPSLQAARGVLDDSQFSQILPDAIQLWGYTRIFAIEHRVATGLNNLMDEPDDHLEQLTNVNTSDENQIWYPFRTRAEHISFSSYMEELSQGQTDASKELALMVIRLHNSVKRQAK